MMNKQNDEHDPTERSESFVRLPTTLQNSTLVPNLREDWTPHDIHECYVDQWTNGLGTDM